MVYFGVENNIQLSLTNQRKELHHNPKFRFVHISPNLKVELAAILLLLFRQFNRQATAVKMFEKSHLRRHCRTTQLQFNLIF